VVGTKNNLAIREFVDENCVPNLFAATGSPAWGNAEYPWMLGTFLVPYPLEAKAFADYLKANKPDATVAILFANDDFGRSYAETFKSEIEGTDITIVGEQNYDPETPDPTNQVTSLARTGADAFLLAATLTACPAALNAMGAAGWDPIVYMSGTCGSKTLMALAGENGDGVITVAPLVDPNDPQYAETEALQLYREKIGQYGDGADATNGIVAYGWTAGAMLVELLSRLDSVSRLSVMEAGRNMDSVQGIGLQIPGVTWGVSADDWFLGESFNLGQYSFADGYFVEVGEVLDFEGRTAEITPPGLING
jgi:branched-chain amino acid transport system substrate-binding protein